MKLRLNYQDQDLTLFISLYQNRRNIDIEILRGYIIVFVHGL